jgi:cysteine desulfurase
MPVALPVYMDNHATTRVDPRVAQAVLEAMTGTYGNAGSTSHVFGWEARERVDAARHSIAAAIGALEREIVFTSGATESNNLALWGVTERARRKKNQIVSVATEHKSVLGPLERLARTGIEVVYVTPSRSGEADAGRVYPDQIGDAITDATFLVSVMMANNEIGALAPLREIALICHERGVLLHSDATQAVGKVPVDVRELQVDLMSFSAHKIYGPKGIGALYVRRTAPQVRLAPLIVGGGQESGLRSGTLNVPGIVGLARALELCVGELSDEPQRLRGLRNRLHRELTHLLPDAVLNGPALDRPEWRLPGNLNLSFPGVDGEALTMHMRDLAVSTGAACSSADPQPSHVLQAIGVSDELTRGSLRFGLGRFNTEEEVDFAAGAVARSVAHLRSLGAKATLAAGL